MQLSSATRAESTGQAKSTRKAKSSKQTKPTQKIKSAKETTTDATMMASTAKAIQSAQDNGPLTTFHKFKHLTPELRHMIWKMILPGARVIPLRPRPSKTACFEIYETKIPTPVTLAICQESRSIALKHFDICLDSPDHPGIIRYNSEIHIPLLLTAQMAISSVLQVLRSSPDMPFCVLVSIREILLDHGIRFPETSWCLS